MSAILPPKKDVALALLERASVFVHLDPRNDEVAVPGWLKQQPQLVLQVGLNMAVKIPDLDVSEDAVSCTLSFSRRPHFCYVPWSAVYALVGEDGRGMVWPEDIPPEVAAQTQAAAPKARPALTSIETGPSKEARSAAQHSTALFGPERQGSKEQGSRSSTPSPSLVALDGAKPSGARGVEPGMRRPASARPHLRLVK